MRFSIPYWLTVCSISETRRGSLGKTVIIIVIFIY